ncbi:MAG TPA: phospholipid scramblase-related protein [Oligoflexus sp.]|uniref:phospholipid scramblase-related protein n=1 Tax=Oligoflexus sp. TaxID=1971216 RepID=UPI002D7E55D1|nr:phospholipid scramblase-related protein [Oligoflexus sp.]HET9236599.1 phospholipid scramblase-related protein [Oligoflexus sp.]
MSNRPGPNMSQHSQVLVRQRHELAEWFGFETRNKYEVISSSGQALAFAAEQGRGIVGLMLRQLLGHWRRFELHFFTPDRQEFMRAVHPFRWYFEELMVADSQGRSLGRVVKRFAILSKKFDVRDASDQVVMTVSSPIWKIWTFPFERNGRQVAVVRKKWSGLLAEAFTDKDTFSLEIEDPSLNEDMRRLLLAAALYIDLMFFEKKAQN